MVSLEVIHLLAEGMQPEGLAYEDHGIQLVLEAWGVSGYSLHQSLSYPVAQLLQFLNHNLFGRLLL